MGLTVEHPQRRGSQCTSNRLCITLRNKEFCRFPPFKTRMNSLIQCIILLACVAICTSASSAIESCRCVRTNKSVKPSLIADAEVYKARPYCNKVEVIVTLTDKTQRCLNPEDKFTKAVLRTIQKQRAELAKRMNSLGLNSTTASPTASPTVTPTSS